MEILVRINKAVIAEDFKEAIFDGEALMIFRSDDTPWNNYVKLEDREVADAILNSIYNQLSDGKSLDLEDAFSIGDRIYYGMQPWMRDGDLEFCKVQGGGK